MAKVTRKAAKPRRKISSKPQAPAIPNAHLSETEFWSSLRVPPRTERAAAADLRRAIRLGLDGQREAAYAALASYHRVVLADHWRHVQHDAAQQPPMAADAVAQLLALNIRGWHQFHQFTGGRIDWNTTAFGLDGYVGFHYLGWTGEPFNEWLRTDNPGLRDFFVREMQAYYDQHPTFRTHAGGSVVFSSLAASRHALLFSGLYLKLIHDAEKTSTPPPLDLTAGLLRMLLVHGRAQFKAVHRFIVHNIHTAGCQALFHIARLFPEFAESTAWERLSRAHLVTHCDRSFYPDGGHLERCWGYGSHTLRRMTGIYTFAQQTGGLGRDEKHYRKRLQDAYRFYAKTLGPGGFQPGYGDDTTLPDGTSILDDARAVFPPATDRWLGADRDRSCLLPDSGFAIMRSGDAADATYANITFGEFAGWHSHFDCLNLNVFAFGQSLLEELSRFGPYGQPLDTLFRAPESHNQVLVDTWHYDNRGITCEDVVWRSDEDVDYFSAYHRAHRAVAMNEHRPWVMSGDVTVRRTILFAKKRGYLVVLDSVRPDGGDDFNRAVSAWWHAPSPFEIVAPNVVRTGTTDASCVMTFAHGDLVRRLERGTDYTRDEQFAPAERHHLRVRSWMKFPSTGCVGFATLIVPVRGPTPDVRIEAIEIPGGRRFRAQAFAVTTPAGRDVVVLNPERLKGVVFDDRPMRHRAELRVDGGAAVVVR